MTAGVSGGGTESPVIRVSFPASGDVTDGVFRAEVAAAVASSGVALVHGFPCEAASLVDFSRGFGELESADPLGPPPDPAEPFDWLGRVNDQESSRFGEPLRLHTASAMHSGAPADPWLQIMLMLDRGFVTEDADGDNGQTMLARVDDTVRALVAERGEAGAEDVLRELLELSVPMVTTPPYLTVRKPVLSRKSDGSWQLRYWEKVLEHAASTGATASALEALEIFDRAMRAAAMQLPLAEGDLIVLDNARVAHGRRGFRTVMDEDGTPRRSTRRLYNAHVMP